MKLTVGMAVYDDFDGVAFTLQALRMHDGNLVDEMIVVDNHPVGSHAEMTRQLCANTGARYIPLPDPVGTSPPRQHLFDSASGDTVLCLDSHVLLWPGTIGAVREFFESPQRANDLLHGVIVFDPLKPATCATHFADQWRREMWGTWATDPRGTDPAGDPFEIPASGLGLFACRREAFPGFNPHCRAFGGEEWYIHEKVRAKGARVWCHPRVRYWHRFGRPKGPSYPLTQWHKVRNYILELQELGMPLDRLRRHFVDGIGEQSDDGSPPEGPLTRMPAETFNAIANDPINTVPPLPGSPKDTRSGCGGCRQSQEIRSVGDWYAVQVRQHPDLSEHLPRLREMAGQCDTVAELGNHSGGSTAAFLASGCRRLYSVGIRQPAWQQAVHRALAEGDPEITILVGDSREIELPEDVDLLFIDTVHRADYLMAELLRHHQRVRRWIVLHDTEIYGEFGEASEGDQRVPGLLPALRAFLADHPQWSVVAHDRRQYGLTVLSCADEDKPKLPAMPKLAANFAKAVASHLATGSRAVDAETLRLRLATCSLCEHRNGDRCSICGCYLTASGRGKAEWAEQACPLGKWLPVAHGGNSDDGDR